MSKLLSQDCTLPSTHRSEKRLPGLDVHSGINDSGSLEFDKPVVAGCLAGARPKSVTVTTQRLMSSRFRGDEYQYLNSPRMNRLFRPK